MDLEREKEAAPPNIEGLFDLRQRIKKERFENEFVSRFLKLFIFLCLWRKQPNSC